MPVGTVTIVAALALAAQGTGPAPGGVPARATLLQVSAAIPAAGAAEVGRFMVAESAKITSCREGLDLAGRLKARGWHGSVTFRTEVQMATLPAPLRDFLATHPAGRATPVFGGGEALRVLIRCEPGFVVPGQDAPSGAGPPRPAGAI